MSRKKITEPTVERVFASDMWRAVGSDGLLVLG